MIDLNRAWTLEQLLKYCGDSASKHYENAWREFLNRYKKLIYKIIIDTCRSYRLPRLQRAIQEVADDCFNDVMQTLLQNDCSAIHNFHAIDDEKQFCNYLAVLSHRASARTLRKLFRNWYVESTPEEVEHLLENLPPAIVWMLYEEMIEDLRGFSKTKTQNQERNIHLFMLYKWKQLPETTIGMIPCFDILGKRTIQVESSRLLNYLRGLKKY